MSVNIGCISKSMIASSDSFCLITSHMASLPTNRSQNVSPPLLLSLYFWPLLFLKKLTTCYTCYRSPTSISPNGVCKQRIVACFAQVNSVFADLGVTEQRRSDDDLQASTKINCDVWKTKWGYMDCDYCWIMGHPRTGHTVGCF